MTRAMFRFPFSEKSLIFRVDRVSMVVVVMPMMMILLQPVVFVNLVVMMMVTVVVVIEVIVVVTRVHVMAFAVVMVVMIVALVRFEMDCWMDFPFFVTRISCKKENYNDDNDDEVEVD